MNKTVSRPLDSKGNENSSHEHHYIKFLEESYPVEETMHRAPVYVRCPLVLLKSDNSP